VALFTVFNGEPVLVINHSQRGYLNRKVIHHELLHYEQWKRGDISFMDGVTWKGTHFSAEEHERVRQLPALHQMAVYPWEAEAYLKSDPMECLLMAYDFGEEGADLLRKAEKLSGITAHQVLLNKAKEALL
jgi:hypothetical protein